MGVHRTRGEPNDIELNVIGVKLNGSRHVRGVSVGSVVPLDAVCFACTVTMITRAVP